jgi:predicted membrane protein
MFIIKYLIAGLLISPIFIMLFYCIFNRSNTEREVQKIMDRIKKNQVDNATTSTILSKNIGDSHESQNTPKA